jgi:hypothetical protein
LRFPYTLREVDPASDEEGLQLVREPIVLVRFIGPLRAYMIRGLVDTGASTTLLPYHYMAKLGVEATGRGQFRTAGGMLPARFGELDIEVGSGPTAQSWRARVGFVPRVDNLAILGHEGFLDHIRATFDGPSRSLTIALPRPGRQLRRR